VRAARGDTFVGALLEVAERHQRSSCSAWFRADHNEPLGDVGDPEYRAPRVGGKPERSNSLAQPTVEEPGVYGVEGKRGSTVYPSWSGASPPPTAFAIGTECHRGSLRILERVVR